MVGSDHLFTCTTVQGHLFAVWVDKEFAVSSSADEYTDVLESDLEKIHTVALEVGQLLGSDEST